MIWAFFALLAAILAASSFALVKKFLKNVNIYVLAGGSFICGFLILLITSIIRGLPEIGSAFYSSVFITVILNIIMTVLYFRALQITDLSLTIPIRSFTPIFLILTSFILLREFPTAFGILGICLIVFGSYILNISKENKHLLDPFKEFFRNKGIFYMLIVALLASITVNFDKLVVLNSDPIFGSAIVYLLLGITFLGLSFVSGSNIIDYKKNIHKLFLLGLIGALTAIVINIAYTMQIVPYVISLKRMSIVFSVLLGGLIFKEKNMFIRIIGVLIMFAGIMIIVLL